jgi:hypothetical protein
MTPRLQRYAPIPNATAFPTAKLRIVVAHSTDTA